ncbi:hypothetical protein DMN91_010016 [Ooceraea biroi]|uniref:MADF domain-containing protein n=1 Tax=Ooceraea biroi TaxID=2015173 RepID=A0A3L8DD11_OOCBI|nr:hypothetical protein DMN91_010016 [Ooceraea biroi]
MNSVVNNMSETQSCVRTIGTTGTATNIEQVQNNVNGHGTEDQEQSSSVSDKKKSRNKEDKQWVDYDELLINAVMNRPCLWNHTIPVKRRGPLVIKEAWIEIASELNGNNLNIFFK